MATNSPSNITEDQEIYLGDVVAALVRRKIMIASVAGACVLAGLLYAVFTTPLYTASVTVKPAVEEEGALGGLAQRFGGAAALAGINLEGGGTDRAEYLAILRSRGLGQRFIERYEIKPYIFPDEWDAERGEWKSNGSGGESPGGGLELRIARLLAVLSGDEGWRLRTDPGPSMWDAYKEFNEKIRTIREDLETGIVTVEFKFRNPELAALWANDYVAMANREIRDSTIREASRALSYLNEEVERTTVTGVRDSIFGLVEGQLERIMLANVRPEYAFKVLDPAVVPEERSHPRRALILAVSLVLGVMLGLFAALVAEVWSGGLARSIVKGKVASEDNSAKDP